MTVGLFSYEEAETKSSSNPVLISSYNSDVTLLTINIGIFPMDKTVFSV